MRDVTVRTAAALQALGVRQGDHVLSWLPNGRNALRVWFGLNYIGAVYVPINLAYKGSLLQHVVRNSDARLIIAHGDLVGRLAEIDRCRIETSSRSMVRQIRQTTSRSWEQTRSIAAISN